MKKLLFFAIVVLKATILSAQNSDFREMVNEGKRKMNQNYFSDASRIFYGAAGYAKSSSEKKELSDLNRQLLDSVSTIYKRGINIANNAKDSKGYSAALTELKKLVPPDNLNVPDIYYWLGYCYEQLNEPYGAIEQYELGVKHKEQHSAFKLAELLQKHKADIISNDSIIRLYEFASSKYPKAKEEIEALKNKQMQNNVEKTSERTNNNTYLSSSNTYSPYTYYGKTSTGFNWDVDDETWGFNYNYAKHFQIIAGANYTIRYFSIGGELGINLDKKQILRSVNETYDPDCFITAIPGFYYKYFSINCGIGALFVQNSKYTRKETNISSEEIDISTSTYVSTEEPKIGLIIKPSLRGYIPISDEYYISIDVGYLYMPKFKDLNGISFGIGFQITID